MKKVLMLTALVVLFAVPAMAAIKDTRHNLGTTGDFGYKSTTATQICVFCHTPHNATKNIPLWNRNNPTGAIALYTSSPSLNMLTKPTDLTTNSISRFCLSCHDAVTSSNLGGRVVNSTETLTMGVTAALDLDGKASIGTNLTNDHPVGFRYDDAYDDVGRDTTIRDRATGPAAAANGALKFFKSDGVNSDFLECATCHEVHGKSDGVGAIPKFLAKRNDSSSLCLTCHNK